MSSVTPRFTDKKARLVLPARFANSAVLIEEVSETELRVCKAVIPWRMNCRTRRSSDRVFRTRTGTSFFPFSPRHPRRTRT
jgi:hypothetical protein